MPRVTRKSKKAEAKPRPDGWDHLPAELKLKCINGLSFKDLFRLRGTCKFDKRLIEAISDFKFKLNLLKLEESQLDIELADGENYQVQFENPSTVISLLAFVLKTSKIDNFYFKESENLDFPTFSDDLQKLLDPRKPIKVKNFFFTHSKTAIQMRPFFLLEKVDGNPENIQINLSQGLISIPSLFEIPSVTFAKNLVFQNPDVRQIGMLIEKWIHNKMDVGTRLQAEIPEGSEKLVEAVFDRFKCREVWKEGTARRIHTFQEDRQICIHYPQHWLQKVLFAEIISSEANVKNIVDTNISRTPVSYFGPDSEEHKRRIVVSDWENGTVGASTSKNEDAKATRKSVRVRKPASYSDRDIFQFFKNF